MVLPSGGMFETASALVEGLEFSPAPPHVPTTWRIGALSK